MGFKSGFISIVGRPNVGKSTLLNALTGNKVAIMSPKPQTTRNTIRAVLNMDGYQIIFIDTPGLHVPKNKLGQYMVSVVDDSIKEVDAIIYMIEANKPSIEEERIAIDRLKNVKLPIFLVINKIDLIDKKEILHIINSYKDVLNIEAAVPLSALNLDGVNILIEEIKKVIPEGPKYFPDDVYTDQMEKFIVAEFIREKVLHLMSDEVPHGVGVEVTSFKERKDKPIIDISATIYCEKESHKGIVIGKRGNMLKKIGMYSREDIERLLGTKVFLEIWVKVKPDWRNNEFMLKNLGYKN